LEIFATIKILKSINASWAVFEMTEQYMRLKIIIKPRLKLWLSSDNSNSVFGEGKWKLLKAIDKYSSIKKSSEVLNISYKKAWNLIKNAEEAIGINLVIKRRGGTAGGATTLTKTGKLIVETFTKYKTSMNTYSEMIFALYFNPVFNKLQEKL